MTKRGRKPYRVPNTSITLRLPVHVLTSLDALLIDPVYGKVPYSNRSEFITALIVAELRRKGLPVSSPKIGVDSSNPITHNE